MSGVIEVLLYYWLPLIFIAVESYLIGGINGSIIVTSVFNSSKDIRQEGSGNPGFTNVLRIFGKKLAVWTFVIDFLKGVLAVTLAQMIISFFSVSGVDFPILTLAKYFSCFMCVIGHMYPCFLNFTLARGLLRLLRRGRGLPVPRHQGLGEFGHQENQARQDEAELQGVEAHGEQSHNPAQLVDEEEQQERAQGIRPPRQHQGQQ